MPKLNPDGFMNAKGRRNASLYLPPETFEKLTKAAEKRGISRNALATLIIYETMEAYETDSDVLPSGVLRNVQVLPKEAEL
mgnify:CR=1 FL=1